MQQMRIYIDWRGKYIARKMIQTQFRFGVCVEGGGNGFFKQVKF